MSVAAAPIPQVEVALIVQTTALDVPALPQQPTVLIESDDEYETLSEWALWELPLH